MPESTGVYREGGAGGARYFGDPVSALSTGSWERVFDVSCFLPFYFCLIYLLLQIHTYMHAAHTHVHTIHTYIHMHTCVYMLMHANQNTVLFCLQKEIGFFVIVFSVKHVL